MKFNELYEKVLNENTDLSKLVVGTKIGKWVAHAANGPGFDQGSLEWKYEGNDDKAKHYNTMELSIFSTPPDDESNGTFNINVHAPDYIDSVEVKFKSTGNNKKDAITYINAVKKSWKKLEKILNDEYNKQMSEH